MSQSGDADAETATVTKRRGESGIRKRSTFLRGRFSSEWDKLALWLPVLAWMVVIYVLSAQSKLPVPKQAPLHWLTENLAHPGEYAILAWLLWRWLTVSGASRGSRLTVASWVIALVYALLDEYHQSFVPGRVADWRDLLADALGAATALALLSIPAVARLCSRRAGRALKDSS